MASPWALVRSYGTAIIIKRGLGLSGKPNPSAHLTAPRDEDGQAAEIFGRQE